MIIMALILMLGLITLFTFRLDRRGPELEADRKTALALAQAKEALLGNSATNGIATASIENPGRLPCPDLDNDGDSEGAVCASYVGRFPWKTLGLSDLRDGAAERLWYVLDAGFFDDGTAMNSVSIPALAVNGNRVVAVIIAPGAVLSGLLQDRSTSGPNPPSNNAANYLESYTNPITTLPPSTPYNDRILTITAKELFTVVTFRMARELASVNSTYPYGAIAITDLTRPPIWMSNDWDSAIDGNGTTSIVTASEITLKFKGCDISYTIKWSGSISRAPRSC